MNWARLLFVIFFGFSAVMAQADTKSWTVALTPKQLAALQDHQGAKGNWAFAVSPDGIWGRSAGFPSADAAAQRAMQFCRNFVRNNKFDCVLHTVNGKQVAPVVMAVKKVRRVYSPINGREAASAIGLSPLNFQGSPEQAKAELARNPVQSSDLTVDPKLRKSLMNRSVVSAKNKGFAVWLGATEAVHIVSANGGKILTADFDSWAVTPSGLVCLFNGRWFPSGKPIGTRCFLLNSVTQGKIDFSWGSKPRARQKANLIAGDARWSVVK